MEVADSSIPPAIWKLLELWDVSSTIEERLAALEKIKESTTLRNPQQSGELYELVLPALQHDLIDSTPSIINEDILDRVSLLTKNRVECIIIVRSCLVLLKQFYNFFSTTEAATIDHGTHPTMLMLVSLLTFLRAAMGETHKWIPNDLFRVMILILRDLPIPSDARRVGFGLISFTSRSIQDSQILLDAFEIAHLHLTPVAAFSPVYNGGDAMALSIISGLFQYHHHLRRHAANHKSFIDALFWFFTSIADETLDNMGNEGFYYYLASSVLRNLLDEEGDELQADLPLSAPTLSSLDVILYHDKFPDILSMISRVMFGEEGGLVLAATAILPRLCSGPPESIAHLYRHGTFELILKLSNSSISDSGPAMARDALRNVLKTAAPEDLFRIACLPHFWKCFVHCVSDEWGQPLFINGVLKPLLDFGEQIELHASSASDIEPRNSWRDYLLENLPYRALAQEDDEREAEEEEEFVSPFRVLYDSMAPR